MFTWSFMCFNLRIGYQSVLHVKFTRFLKVMLEFEALGLLDELLLPLHVFFQCLCTSSLPASRMSFPA